MPLNKDIIQKHPQWPAVLEISRILSLNSFQAVLAGGCVRDLILGRDCKDLDVATDALPEDIERLFAKVLTVGKSFGVCVVLLLESQIEVATFREDGNYVDGRHPEKVKFSSLERDADRRDFTMNALFLELSQFKILDFVEGQKDIQAKLIRAVGDPDLRFSEDHLRIFRALRFKAQLNFEIEDLTWKSIVSNGPKVQSVSFERKKDELVKLLCSASPIHLDSFYESKVAGALFSFWTSSSHEKAMKIWKKVFPVDLKLHTDIFWSKNSLLGSKLEMLERNKALCLVSFFIPFVTEVLINLEDWLQQWTFSKNIQSIVLGTFRYYLDLDDFFKKKMGEKVQFLANSSAPIVDHLISRLGESYQINEWQKLKDYFILIAPDGILPSPVLTGHDLMPLASGPELGRMLRMAYVAQLEGEFTSLSDGIKWIKQAEIK